MKQPDTLYKVEVACFGCPRMLDSQSSHSRSPHLMRSSAIPCQGRQERSRTRLPRMPHAESSQPRATDLLTVDCRHEPHRPKHHSLAFAAFLCCGGEARLVCLCTGDERHRVESGMDSDRIGCRPCRSTFPPARMAPAVSFAAFQAAIGALLHGIVNASLRTAVFSEFTVLLF